MFQWFVDFCGRVWASSGQFKWWSKHLMTLGVKDKTATAGLKGMKHYHHSCYAATKLFSRLLELDDGKARRSKSMDQTSKSMNQTSTFTHWACPLPSSQHPCATRTITGEWVAFVQLLWQVVLKEDFDHSFMSHFFSVDVFHCAPLTHISKDYDNICSTAFIFLP